MTVGSRLFDDSRLRSSFAWTAAYTRQAYPPLFLLEHGEGFPAARIRTNEAVICPWRRKTWRGEARPNSGGGTYVVGRVGRVMPEGANLIRTAPIRQLHIRNRADRAGPYLTDQRRQLSEQL